MVTEKFVAVVANCSFYTSKTFVQWFHCKPLNWRYWNLSGKFYVGNKVNGFIIPLKSCVFIKLWLWKFCWVAISEFYTPNNLCNDIKVTIVYKIMELSGKFYYVVSKVRHGFF